MRRLLKAFVIVCAAGLLAFGMAGVALAAAVVHSGLISVSVQEKTADGTRIFLPVPAALIELGASTLPLVMPERELARARREIAPYRQGLRQLASELDDMPSATLVTVESAKERVKVAKQGRNLTIEVHSDEADVRVSLPAASLGRLLDALS